MNGNTEHLLFDSEHSEQVSGNQHDVGEKKT